jgi:hypothetical protein
MPAKHSLESVRSIPARHDSGVLPACDRSAAATLLAEAEALLARDELERAAERFQAATRAFDDVGDAAGGARALLGLGRVLLGLEDPACRAVLEDAGTWLEDLGDEAGVRQVEQLLRAAESSVEQESPRSFHSAGLMRASSEIPPPRD